MDTFKPVMSNKVSRRKFIHGVSAGMGVTAAAGLAAGCSNAPGGIKTPAPVPAAFNDTDLLNFALQFEYLEAEYYLRATTGTGLTAADAGTGAGAVTGGAQVQFATPAIQQYAVELANDELQHVRFLRSQLGAAATARPAIDFTGGFNAAASAASIGSSFNAFADEKNFLVGAFTFVEVGVSAYNGAGPLLTDKKLLAAAGSIVATEAYHGGLTRTLLAYLGGQYVTYANQISALRGQASAAAGGSTGAAETPLSAGGSVSIVAADANSIGFSRVPNQVLHIVYLSTTPGAVSKGGFYPSGINGTITASTL